jgi:hypothetical protein
VVPISNFILCYSLAPSLVIGTPMQCFKILCPRSKLLPGCDVLAASIGRRGSYLTGNTLQHPYKAQPVNAVWGNSRCLLWEPYGTHKCTLCGQVYTQSLLNCKGLSNKVWQAAVASKPSAIWLAVDWWTGIMDTINPNPSVRDFKDSTTTCNNL